MKGRNAWITILVTTAMVLGSALGIAIYRNEFDLENTLQFVWGSSFVMVCIGCFLRVAASSGREVTKKKSFLAASIDREGYEAADDADAYTGFAFGTLIMFSGLVLFCLSLAVLYLVFQ